MTPLPLTTAIERLFALLNEYLLEDGHRKDGGLNPFVDWLRANMHDELADVACSNANVADSLRFLMEQHRF